jgi:hypothetical protein
LEATDAANIRSAYAVIQSAALMQDDLTTIAKNNNSTTTFTVPSESEGFRKYQAVVLMKQTQNDWQSGAQDIGGINVPAIGTVIGGGTCTIVYDQSTNATTLSWG